MKTTIIVMAAILASGVAYASGNIKLSMKPADKERAMVEIINEARDEVEIDVINNYGEVIFSKKVIERAANYQRKYDFKDLADGNYILRVRSDKELNETHFEMYGGEFSVTDERKVIEPHVKTAGNIWKMAYLNFPLEEMNLYVYEGSRLLYQEDIDPVFAVHKALDLTELLPGDYQIVFANRYNAYTYNVEVR